MRPIYAPELMLESEAADIAIRWSNFESSISARFEHKGIIVEVFIRRKGIPLLASAPTECESDIIAVMTATGRFLTQPQVLDELSKAGKLHGESTILKALTRMAKEGRLHHAKRRGYGLPS